MKIKSNNTHKSVSIFNADPILEGQELISKGVSVITDELGTTLADELEVFNDIPLTKSEKRELGFIAREQERDRIEVEGVLKRLAEKAGVNVDDDDYRAYC